MLRLLTATLAVAFFVLPACAAEPGLRCVDLPTWTEALQRTGQTVLGVQLAPFTQTPTLYWHDPVGLVIMAPVLPADGDGSPCVVFERAVPLGAYVAGRAS